MKAAPELLGIYKQENYYDDEIRARRTYAFKMIAASGKKVIKTQMCPNLKKCPRGDKCTYAHSQAELRKPKCQFGETCKFKKTCTYDHSETYVPPIYTPDTVIKPVSDAPVRKTKGKRKRPSLDPTSPYYTKLVIEPEDVEDEIDLTKKAPEEEEKKDEMDLLDEILESDDEKDDPEEERHLVIEPDEILASDDEADDPLLSPFQQLKVNEEEQEAAMIAKLAEEAIASEPVSSPVASTPAFPELSAERISNPWGVLYPDPKLEPVKLANLATQPASTPQEEMQRQAFLQNQEAITNGFQYFHTPRVPVMLSLAQIQFLRMHGLML
jgi:hypothetical protein